MKVAIVPENAVPPVTMKRPSSVRFGAAEATFGRPANLAALVAVPEPSFESTSTHCYRCNGTIHSVACPDGKPGCEVFHHEHVCPRDEGKADPALPLRHP